MTTFRQNKLWRDKIFVRLNKPGAQIAWRKLSDAEFANALKEKLCEEAQEVAEAKSQENLIEELADVFEVIDSLCELKKISKEQIKSAQKKKYLEKGGFEKRIFVEHATYEKGSVGEKYCLDDPKKYPQVI